MFTGVTNSRDYPTTPNAFQRRGVALFRANGFVSALDLTKSGSAQLAWSTFFSGGNADIPYAIDVHRSGLVTIVGSTGSANIPQTTSHRRAYGSGNEGFVAQLDRTKVGNAQLLYGTLLGGPGNDILLGCTTDARGDITFGGLTTGASAPTTPGAFDRKGSVANDIYFGRIAPTRPRPSDLTYATYVAGNSWEFAMDLTIDADGEVTATGTSNSPDLPMRNARQPTNPGGQSGFITHFELLPNNVRRLGSTNPHCGGGVIFEVDRQPAANQPLTFAVGNAPPNAQGVLLLGFALGPPLKVAGIDVWIDLQRPYIPLALSANAVGTSSWSLPPQPKWTGGFAAQTVWLETGSCVGRKPLAASAALGF